MGESAPDMSSADLFDHIDDFLDFPTEDIDAAVAGDGLQSWPSDDAFALGTTALAEYSGQHELSVPCDDLAELEWLSNFVEDSFSVGSVESELQSGNNGSFRTSSPVSVLESSSCSGRMLDVLPSVPGRARTKRPRPPIPLPRPAISITIANYSDTAMISSSSSTTTFSCECQPEAEFFAESKLSKKGGGRKRKWSEQSGAAPRKCLHCESQKTPQWRAGPLGPKTLCNACGVRYKSGRLFPEYRPAASPTFVAEEHSNSHKKVMEMRVKRRPMGEPELVYQRNPIMSFM